MSSPCVSACSPWATTDDVCEPCDGYIFSLGLLDQTLAIATDLLYELSGQRWPGSCQDTVRPQNQCHCPTHKTCACSGPPFIVLGANPITSIVEVKVDGVVVDSSLYRIDDFHDLIRLPDPDGTNPGWPCCPRLDLASTEVGTFEVTFTYGVAPPPAGVHAAAILACELAQSCSPIDGVECRLPRRVQSITRQGVSMVLLDPMEFLRGGKTGIYEVDIFLSAYAPHGSHRRSTVINVDLINPVRRVGT